MRSTLIFDYDGVIVDSLHIFMKYFFKACDREGFSNINSKQVFLSLFEGNMFEKMMDKGMSKEQILRIMDFMKKELLKNQGKLQVFPGIKKTLKTLSKKNTLLIITSNDSIVVKRFLSSQNLDIFSDIYGSEKEPSKVKKIQRIKQQYHRNNVFYIGDTTGDIIEGKEAKVQTIAVTWGWHDTEKLQKTSPAYILSEPQELLTLFA